MKIPALAFFFILLELAFLSPAWLWVFVILGAVVTLAMGLNQGLEFYAELPLWLDILVVVAWVMFGANIFATIATRK